MIQYTDLIRRVLTEGARVPDRTGTGTLAVFGHQMRFDLTEGFPLVTVKKTNWRAAFVEMLWFLRGDTNIAWLHEHGVHIWDQWADKHGDLGPIYGEQWRGSERVDTDQFFALLKGLHADPHSRRHIVNAWSPEHLPEPGIKPSEQPALGLMALAPCHCLVQFFVSPSGRLSCQVYQRSADVFLGVPFNIAGYALLTHLLARHLGYRPGELIWTGGDVHLYANHLDQAAEVLRRDPLPLPTLIQHHEPGRPLWEIEPHELEVVGYASHPAIPAPVAV